MKSIRDTCIEFFKGEEIKKDIKEMIHPVVDIIYNEIYVYIWLICVYNVFLICIILANLYLLVKLQNIWNINSPRYNDYTTKCMYNI